MSQFENICESIELKSEASKRYLVHIKRIRRYIRSLNIDSFFEPVSVIEDFNGSQKLGHIDGDLINSWIQHVCYSSRIKMMELELGILREISEDCLLSSMVLIRSHMESAGLVAYCYKKFRESLQKENFNELEFIIPKTFFGTSIFRAGKHNEWIKSSLKLAERDKISTSKLISALEEHSINSEGSIQGYYALLCEFTHPNLRAMKDYIKSTEKPIEGWEHQYTTNITFSKEHFKMSLELLLCFMKTGHTITETFRNMYLFESNGIVQLHQPDESQLKGIWESVVGV